MCRKMIFLIFLILVVGPAGSALAWDVTIRWNDGDPTDHLWNRPGNWDQVRVPNLYDNVAIGSDDPDDPNRFVHGPVIDSTVTAECGRLVSGFIDSALAGGGTSPTDPDGAMLYISGGSLLVTSWWGHAEWANSVATIDMSGGNVRALRGIGVGQNGYGTLNMTGGFMNIVGTRGLDGLWIPGTATAKYGHVQLDAGTIDTRLFLMRMNNNPGTMDITEGTLVIQGDARTRQDRNNRTLMDYIGNGWLTAYGGAGDLVVIYDSGADETIVIARTPPGPCATNPAPRNGAYHVQPDVVLSWTPGVNAAGPNAHEIYLGTDYDAVNSATTSSPEYKGSQGLDANSYDPGGLDLGWTYYWRIDEVDGGRCKGKVWSFTVIEGKASNPSPENGSWDTPLDVSLSWTPGPLANWHDVYFGTDFDEVRNATDPNTLPGRGRQDESSYYPPGDLELFTRYYWRIDEVSATTYVKGEVWSFMTTGAGETLLKCDVSENEINLREGWTLITKDEYYSSGPAITLEDVAGTGIDVTLRTGDASALTGWDRRGEPLGRDYFYAKGREGSPKGDFIMTLSNLSRGDYTLTTFHNNTEEAPTLLSSVDVRGAVSVSVPDTDVVQAQSLTDDAVGFSRVTFTATGAGNVIVSYVCHKTNKLQAYFNGFILDRIPPDPNYAHYPDPAHGAKDVPPDAVLSWTPGDYASLHDVYFGTNWDDVDSATKSSPEYKGTQVLDANSYDPGGLVLGTTYYWRIDEINDPCTWKGDVWRFTVVEHILVDDMESYDPSVNRIGDTWLDGWVNNTGSEVSLGSLTDLPPSPVNGGDKSMIYAYDNGDSFGYGLEYYSEIERTFDTPQDWTELGVKVLTLYFYGDPNNDANDTEQMCVGLEDSRGVDSYAEVKYGYYSDEDINDIKIADWQEWNIALADFTGVNLTSVKKVYIGFGIRGNLNPSGTPGGLGTVYFDDIRLYPPKCITSRLKPVGDLTDDCVVDFADVGIMAEQWLKADAYLAIQAPGDANLVGWWQLEEGEGGDVNDSSGNEYHGTAEGAYKWVAGRVGEHAIDFGGGWVVVPDEGNTPHLRPPNEVTVTAWIYRTEFANAWMHLVTKGEDDEETFGLEVNPDNALTFIIRGPKSGDLHDLGSKDALPCNYWIHVAGTYDGNNLTSYVNGQVELTDQIGSVALFADVNDALTIAGRWKDTDERFIGTVDDVRVYNKGLSDAEIAYLATEGTGLFVMQSPANLYDKEELGDRAVNFRDYAVLAENWLEKKLWPLE